MPRSEFHTLSRIWARLFAVAFTIGLTACGGPSLADPSGFWVLLIGRGGGPDFGTQLNGEVNGVVGRGLMIQVNDGSPMSIHRDGSFSAPASAAAPVVRILRQPRRPEQKCAIQSTGEREFQIHCDDRVAPAVIGAAVLRDDRVRVYFSRYLDASAGDPAYYRVIPNGGGVSPGGACDLNANFSNAAWNLTDHFRVASATVVENYVELSFSAPALAGSAYSILVDQTRVHDRAATPNYLSCANRADFRLNAAPRLLEARCSGDDRSVLLTFSQPIPGALNTPGSALCSGGPCADRFRIVGGRDDRVGDFSVESVHTPDGSLCAGSPIDPGRTRFCLSHATLQSGVNYAVLAANGRDGDGFDNQGCGDGLCALAGDSLVIGDAPDDRATFAGCGGGLPQLADDATEALAVNPFADDATSGTLTVFRDRVLVGPGANGNVALQFRPDGSEPRVLSFGFVRDSISGSGGATHANRAGADRGAEFRTIGATGCVPDRIDPLLGCGPNNEDGQGVFTSGSMYGREYLFLTGTRESGDNDYIYYTDSAADHTVFQYLDLSDSFNNVWAGPSVDNRGVESLHTHNNRMYVVMPGDNMNRPYVVKVNRLTREIQEGDTGHWMHLGMAPGFGRRARTRPALADILGGHVFSFQDRVYVAGSGSVRQTATGGYSGHWPGDTAPVFINVGGLIRSRNGDPGPCVPWPGPDGQGDRCPDWADITPTTAWFTHYFSIVLKSLSDLIPAERPFPAATGFQGNLYLIRNACEVNMIGSVCDRSRHECLLDDTACPAGREVPQLWKCRADLSGDRGACDSGDWTPVAMNGRGKTNFGDVENRWVSLLSVSGGRLYLGFDNLSTGAELWRSRAGVDDPTSAIDFEKVGPDGFGDPQNRTRIFSSASASHDGADFLYITAGDSQGLSLFAHGAGRTPTYFID
ncbi:MAG: hypothetical protein RIF32_05975 [Leptospirales bacterium]